MNPEFSISQVVSNSWQRMVKVLFKPFDFYKWLVLAFCAWLSNMNSGGGNFNFPAELLPDTDASTPGEAVSGVFEQLQNTIGLSLLIFFAVLLFVVLPVFVIIMLWVKSRFDFVLLDNLVWNRNEVKKPWAKFKKQGNSLFWAYLGIGILFILFLVVFGFIFLAIILQASHDSSGGTILFLVMVLLIFLAFLLVITLVYFIIHNLVVPVMYHKDLRFTEAFRIVYGLICRNLGKFIILVLLSIGLGIAFAVALVAAIVGTCCILAFVMIIPVIGTMPLLPAFVLFRYLGPEFLAAIDPDMNVFAPAEAPPVSEPQAISTVEA